MINKEIINKVKSATVAIGLLEEGSTEPTDIVGKGFLVSPDGCIITAGHVSENCRIIAQYQRETFGKKLKRAAFFAPPNQGKGSFTPFPIIDGVAKPTLEQIPAGFSMSPEIDLRAFKIVPEVQLPFLEIKKYEEIELYEEIVTCGFPTGIQAFTLSTKYLGSRINPIIQFGRIVSFFPTDGSPVPNAIQTDIVGTVGSSGSPIVDLNGRVVGIALEILKTPAGEGKHPSEYTAHIGLIYGLTTNILYPFIISQRDHIEGKAVNSQPFDTTTMRDIVLDRTSFQTL